MAAMNPGARWYGRLSQIAARRMGVENVETKFSVTAEPDSLESG